MDGDPRHDGHEPGDDHGHGPAHGSGHGHGHGHGHGTDLDWNAMGETIERRAQVYAPLYAQIIAAVRERVPDPGLIVDAGSGPGAISRMLAEAFPAAEVVALDSAPGLLERAERQARDAGLSGRLRTLLGELPGAFDELAGADVVWLGQSLHHVGDQRAALAAAARALAPGGLLVLLEGGLPARCLPRDIGIGRPGLQSRLTAANEEWFATMRASLPGSVHEVEDWPALLTAAGLASASARSFLLDLPAPIPPEVRDHLVSTLEREREMAAERLAADDVATLDRLLDPEDPASLRHRGDAFLLVAQTVYFAVRA
jgi:SAM-dependent methyltransferase